MFLRSLKQRDYELSMKSLILFQNWLLSILKPKMDTISDRFFIDQSGQLSASYQGSAARMEIQHIERSEYEMSVYYLFQYIGNEVSDESGPVRFFYFTVTAEQMEEGLQEEEDGMFIKVLVTEINKGDIPGEVQS